ncbi:hypothetical protein Natpe_1865 [Natrinema pellirubrum DSM 15624]|uniref:Uncharacterized protein n=1 Tax=Natrinema pellirubrum (strain DSM 15624 / CIP 106293 / JCM 10476 / NCIMB 786 / 157) TaxID=797303 RepID=L0JMY0_NATP1|nr:hypothetical protein Natpe_1865 [Natrinema pellirubrum DSM 15624]
MLRDLQLENGGVAYDSLVVSTINYEDVMEKRWKRGV